MTIKCGKETITPIDIPINTPIDDIKHDNMHNNMHINMHSKQYNMQHKQDTPNRYEKKPYNHSDRNYRYQKPITVKLSELPLDISESELYELMYNWGNVMKIKVMYYNESATAYIDFMNSEEANYFVEAIHRTPFDSFIISADVC